MRRTREAVALAYGKLATPIVTAKGSDDVALDIIADIAQDAQLVSALSRLDLEQEIPRDLYVAVAVVLSWAYWLKDMKPGDEKR